MDGILITTVIEYMVVEKKDTTKLVTISTWQSLYQMPKNFFNKFGVIMGDEVSYFQSRFTQKDYAQNYGV